MSYTDGVEVCASGAFLQLCRENSLTPTLWSVKPARNQSSAVLAVLRHRRTSMSHSNNNWTRGAVPAVAPHNNMLGGQQNYHSDHLAVASWQVEAIGLDTTAVHGWA